MGLRRGAIATLPRESANVFYRQFTLATGLDRRQSVYLSRYPENPIKRMEAQTDDRSRHRMHAEMALGESLGICDARK